MRKRTFSPHVKWNDADVASLRDLYATAPWPVLMERFPLRNRAMILGKANSLGLRRLRPAPRTPDQVREAKRKLMAERRLANPELARARGREYHRKHAAKHNQKMRDYTRRRFFASRARKVPGMTASLLASIWKKQRGRCALTGRRMGRDAQVDHVVPRARGGSDDATNIRWVCPEANLAKRDLLDHEFVALCGDVMRWIGERIAFVDKIAT